jgi:hypothetical protein
LNFITKHPRQYHTGALVHHALDVTKADPLISKAVISAGYKARGNGVNNDTGQ